MSFIILKMVIILHSILVKIWFFGLKLHMAVNSLFFFTGPLRVLPLTTPTHFNIFFFALCKPCPVSLFYFFLLWYFYYVQISDKHPQSLSFEVLSNWTISMSLFSDHNSICQSEVKNLNRIGRQMRPKGPNSINSFENLRLYLVEWM